MTTEKEVTDHDMVLTLEGLIDAHDRLLKMCVARLLNLEKFVEDIYEYLKKNNEHNAFLLEQILKIRLLETPPKNRRGWRDELIALTERVEGVENYVSQYRDKGKRQYSYE